MTENLNPFAIAQAQLDKAAGILQLNPDMHAFLREPLREFHFSIPVRMDDSHTPVSYTHLDVYKRQVGKRAAQGMQRAAEGMADSQGTTATLEAITDVTF